MIEERRAPEHHETGGVVPVAASVLRTTAGCERGKRGEYDDREDGQLAEHAGWSSALMPSRHDDHLR